MSELLQAIQIDVVALLDLNARNVFRERYFLIRALPNSLAFSTMACFMEEMH